MLKSLKNFVICLHIKMFGEFKEKKIVRIIYMISRMVVSQLILRIYEGKTMKIIETFCSLQVF